MFCRECSCKECAAKRLEEAEQAKLRRWTPFNAENACVPLCHDFEFDFLMCKVLNGIQIVPNGGDRL